MVPQTTSMEFMDNIAVKMSLYLSWFTVVAKHLLRKFEACDLNSIPSERKNFISGEFFGNLL